MIMTCIKILEILEKKNVKTHEKHGIISINNNNVRSPSMKNAGFHSAVAI